MDVTCVGDVNVDLITSRVGDYPSRDSQILLSDLRVSSGGCSANCAKASALLGLKTRLIGKAGRDLFGSFLRRDIEVENLDVRLESGERTGATIAIPFTDGTRSFLTFTGSNSQLTIEDIDLGLIEGKYLHVASFFLQGLRGKTKKLFDYAHERGMITCLDTGFDPCGWSRSDVALVRKVLGDVDIFFPNLGEARAVSGLEDKEEACDMLLGLGPSIVALKMGVKGSLVCTGKERAYTPAYKVRVVDSTGAGDVFGAGFIYARLRGWGIKKAGRFANAAAALSTLGYGSERYPRVSEVRRLSCIPV